MAVRHPCANLTDRRRTKKGLIQPYKYLHKPVTTSITCNTLSILTEIPASAGFKLNLQPFVKTTIHHA